MNSNANRNFLINAASEDIAPSLLQIALQFAEKGFSVLYLAENPIDKFSVTTKSDSAVLPNEVLRNITFRYCKTLSSLLKTILELYTWKQCPKLVILESMHTFFTQVSSESGRPSYSEFVENHSLLIAALQYSVNCLSKKMSDNNCFSLVSTDFRASPHYEQFRSQLVDLYYSKLSKIEDISKGSADLTVKSFILNHSEH